MKLVYRQKFKLQHNNFNSINTKTQLEIDNFILKILN